MPGLDRHTVRTLTPDAHLAQSIGDILSTPVGSRVMRRDYGSDLPRLIDAPMNGETTVDLFVATADALDRWEPRFALTRVALAGPVPGRITLILTGDVAGEATVIETTIGAPQ